VSSLRLTTHDFVVSTYNVSIITVECTCASYGIEIGARHFTIAEVVLESFASFTFSCNR